jgi:hypothetical protein
MMGRAIVHLAIVSMVTMTVALACQRCLAFADASPPVQTEHSCPSCDTVAPDCDCPALEQVAGNRDLPAAAAQAHPAPQVSAAFSGWAAQPDFRIAGAMLAGDPQLVPRLSPIRSFCIRLE